MRAPRAPSASKAGRYVVNKSTSDDDGIKPVAFHLRPAVDGIMLGRGDGLEEIRIVPLQALDERDAQAAGEVGVFAVGLLAAAPARIAENVDVGRPEIQPGVDGAVVVARGRRHVWRGLRRR